MGRADAFLFSRRCCRDRRWRLPIVHADCFPRAVFNIESMLAQLHACCGGPQLRCGHVFPLAAQIAWLHLAVQGFLERKPRFNALLQVSGSLIQRLQLRWRRDWGRRLRAGPQAVTSRSTPSGKSRRGRRACSSSLNPAKNGSLPRYPARQGAPWKLLEGSSRSALEKEYASASWVNRLHQRATCPASIATRSGADSSL